MGAIEAGEKWKQQRRRRFGAELSGYELWERDVQNRIDAQWDAVVAMTGRRGTGKSTAARKIGRRLDPDFTIERQVCFSFPEVKEVSEVLSPGQVIVWDEIIEGGMAREWNQQNNRNMEKFFTISRDLGLVTIICAPHIDMFDTSLRRRFFTDWLLKESRSSMKVHVAGFGGDYPGRDRGWIDVCRVACTADTEANDAIYRRKKDASRQAIGEAESPGVDVQGLLRAADRVRCVDSN